MIIVTTIKSNKTRITQEVSHWPSFIHFPVGSLADFRADKEQFRVHQQILIDTQLRRRRHRSILRHRFRWILPLFASSVLLAATHRCNLQPQIIPEFFISKSHNIHEINISLIPIGQLSVTVHFTFQSILKPPQKPKPNSS